MSQKLHVAFRLRVTTPIASACVHVELTEAISYAVGFWFMMCAVFDVHRSHSICACNVNFGACMLSRCSLYVFT